MTSTDTMEFVVCGRAIGRANGWDQSDTFSMMLYGLVPALETKLPAGDVLFRFENGTVEQYADDGELITSLDLIDSIKDAPIARTDE